MSDSKSGFTNFTWFWIQKNNFDPTRSGSPTLSKSNVNHAKENFSSNEYKLLTVILKTT